MKRHNSTVWFKTLLPQVRYPVLFT